MASVLTLTANSGQLGAQGARSNASGRFERERRWLLDDGWQRLGDEPTPQFETQILHDVNHTIISRNSSPDIFFRSVN